MKPTRASSGGDKEPDPDLSLALPGTVKKKDSDAMKPKRASSSGHKEPDPELQYCAKSESSTTMTFGVGSSSSKEIKNVEPQTYSSKDAVSQGPRKKLTALVVEDNVVIRKTLRMLLTNMGVESQEVVNGKEAVDLCLSGAVFDLILIDMEMPVMNGPEATRVLRSMGFHSKMIGISSNTQDKEKQKFMEAGLDEFYIKPITRAKLISIIQELNNSGVP